MPANEALSVSKKVADAAPKESTATASDSKAGVMPKDEVLDVSKSGAVTAPKPEKEEAKAPATKVADSKAGMMNTADVVEIPSKSKKMKMIRQSRTV